MPAPGPAVGLPPRRHPRVVGATLDDDRDARAPLSPPSIPNRSRFGMLASSDEAIRLDMDRRDTLDPSLITIRDRRPIPMDFAPPHAGIRCGVVYSLAMQSVADWKGSRAMTVQRDRGRWRYRTTAYYADGTSARITGSPPRYEDTRDKALAMEAEHVARVRALLPGQEETTEPTPIAAPSEPPKPLVPTVQEFHTIYLDSKRLPSK